jgi:hypothetical protein
MMGTASEASPKLSGHLTLSGLVTVLRCCSTYLNNVTSPFHHPMERRFGATVTVDLALVEMVALIYLHGENHLMVMKIAVHMQINLAIKSLSKAARTCSQTRRIERSQLLK